MRGIERSYNGMEWIGRTWRVKIGSFEPRLLEKPPVVPRAMSYTFRESYTLESLYHRSILNAALPRRINTAYRPRIYPYLSISSPRVKTCTLQSKCRFVVERGIKNTLVEQCDQRLDVFKEASRCFCFEKEIESLEFLQSRIRFFFFFKNLSRWKIGSVVRIYV